MIFDEEEEAKPTDVTYEDEDEEEPMPKLEEADTKDEAD